MIKITGEFICRKSCAYHNGVKYPRGSNCFYVKLNDKRGLKVYYGLERKQLLKRHTVRKMKRYAEWLAKSGVSLKPFGKEQVILDIVWRGDKVKCIAWGIIVKHLDMEYSIGKDKYKKELMVKMNKLGIEHRDDYYKDCNIGYDHETKKFWLTDWR